MHTSFRTDLSRRRYRYADDFLRSGATKFAAGNMFYGLFLLVQTGWNMGSIATVAIQTPIALYTARKQLQATYEGEKFDTPYKVQGIGNFLTAAFTAMTGIASATGVIADNKAQMPDHPAYVLALNDPAPSASLVAEKPKSDLWSQMIFPTVTFAAWGTAHFCFGAAARRRRKLKGQGIDDQDMGKDAALKQSEQHGAVASGVADIMAIFKDKSLPQAQETITIILKPEIYNTPFDPANLQHLNSVLGLPFFVIGFGKSLLGESRAGRRIQAFENNVTGCLPEFSHRALHIENQGITPVHYYAAGYAGTGVVSGVLAFSDPVHAAFAAASMAWAWGYHDLTAEHTPAPESADAYARRLGFLEPA